MNTEEKTKMQSRRSARHSMFDFYPESYAALSLEYWFTLFISGILIMWVFGLLGWRVGIAWFFLSNFISILLVRIDMTANANVLLWYEKRNTNYFTGLLN